MNERTATTPRHHPATAKAWAWLNEQTLASAEYDRLAAILLDLDAIFLDWDRLHAPRPFHEVLDEDDIAVMNEDHRG